MLFSSIAGHNGERGASVYAATKAAIRLATYSFCSEIAREGHRVNTISPGWVKTELMSKSILLGVSEESIGRYHILGIGEPSDVSGIVLFLLSNRAKWITGEDFVVDGGALRGKSD